ncbi:unnamed protein product [Urochloa humidicola]
MCSNNACILDWPGECPGQRLLPYGISLTESFRSKHLFRRRITLSEKKIKLKNLGYFILVGTSLGYFIFYLPTTTHFSFLYSHDHNIFFWGSPPPLAKARAEAHTRSYTRQVYEENKHTPRLQQDAFSNHERPSYGTYVE